MSEPTGFLYPFIDQEERDAATLAIALSSSARAKILESGQLTAGTLERLQAGSRTGRARHGDAFRTRRTAPRLWERR